jgi:NitT/TauT family transport system permease protein
LNLGKNVFLPLSFEYHCIEAPIVRLSAFSGANDSPNSLLDSLPDLLQNIASLFVLPDFYASIGATIGRGMVGFVISFITAFICALLSSNSGFWKDFFHPILVVIRSVPVISLVLIALLWFSPNQLPVFIALLTMWPVLYQNMLNGLESTDERLVEMARVFGKTKMQRLEHIYLPSAKNLIFSGISTAMGFGWRAVIIGEVLSQPFRGIVVPQRNRIVSLYTFHD